MGVRRCPSTSTVCSIMLTTLCLSLLVSMSSGAQLSDTLYCNECTEVTIASTGLVSDTVPQLLGVYQVAGSIHDDLFPFWQSEDGGAYLTTDPISDPAIQWLRWVVAAHQEGWNAWIRNGHDVFTTFNCPYDVEDPDWEVKIENGTWVKDTTMTVTCTSL